MNPLVSENSYKLFRQILGNSSSSDLLVLELLNIDCWIRYTVPFSFMPFQKTMFCEFVDVFVAEVGLCR